MAALILVTGANGYIASRLIPRLLERGYRVRALVREPERLEGRAWLSRVEVMPGSTTMPDTLPPALDGAQTAYYLVHNMASGRGYMQIEREGAREFASAAEAAGVQHIIYLGGLADPNAKNLAPHMRSRMETGEILRQARVPVTEFRAGVIVGAGSISFEMIRFLTECFPLLPGPSSLLNQVQPISAANVIDYLTAAAERTQARGGIYETGGPDRMRYADTMLRYARTRGLRRLLFTLPGIPISLMARFVDWLTPVPYPIATALVGGLQSDSVVRDDAARRLFPEIILTPYEDSVRAAIRDLSPARLERVWVGMGRRAIAMKHEGFFVDYRRLEVNASAPTVFRTFAAMGGRRGWLYANWLWRLRGLIDKAVSPRALVPGNVSPQEHLRREDPRPETENAQIAVGQRVDYYRVEALEPNRLLRLRSELHAPGDGWMEWSVDAMSEHTALLTQTAFFAPRGLPGFLYWFGLGPLHRLVFRGQIRAIRERSEAA